MTSRTPGLAPVWDGIFGVSQDLRIDSILPEDEKIIRGDDGGGKKKGQRRKLFELGSDEELDEDLELEDIVETGKEMIERQARLRDQMEKWRKEEEEERKIRYRLWKEKGEVFLQKMLNKEGEEDEKKQKRHEKWAKQGEDYSQRMVYMEMKREAKLRKVRQDKRRKLAAIAAEKERERLQFIEEMRERKRKLEEEKRRIDEKTVWYEDGSRYFGDFVGSQRIPHGFGQWFVGTTLRYEGMFFQGERHGKGKLYLDGGEMFDGTWNFGMKHGLMMWRKPYKAVKSEMEMLNDTDDDEPEPPPPRAAIFFRDRFAAWHEDLKDGLQISVKIMRSYGQHHDVWKPAVIVAKDETGPLKKRRFQVRGPWVRPKWVDLTKLEFRTKTIHLAFNCIKPETITGRTVDESKKSDPLTPAFRKHLKYKLDSFNRASLVSRAPGIVGRKSLVDKVKLGALEGE